MTSSLRTRGTSFVDKTRAQQSVPAKGQMVKTSGFVRQVFSVVTTQPDCSRQRGRPCANKTTKAGLDSAHRLQLVTPGTEDGLLKHGTVLATDTQSQTPLRRERSDLIPKLDPAWVTWKSSTLPQTITQRNYLRPSGTENTHSHRAATFKFLRRRLLSHHLEKNPAPDLVVNTSSLLTG